MLHKRALIPTIVHKKLLHINYPHFTHSCCGGSGRIWGSLDLPSVKVTFWFNIIQSKGTVHPCTYSCHKINHSGDNNSKVRNTVKISQCISDTLDLPHVGPFSCVHRKPQHCCWIHLLHLLLLLLAGSWTPPSFVASPTLSTRGLLPPSRISLVCTAVVTWFVSGFWLLWLQVKWGTHVRSEELSVVDQSHSLFKPCERENNTYPKWCQYDNICCNKSTVITASVHMKKNQSWSLLYSWVIETQMVPYSCKWVSMHKTAHPPLLVYFL